MTETANEEAAKPEVQAGQNGIKAQPASGAKARRWFDLFLGITRASHDDTRLVDLKKRLRLMRGLRRLYALLGSVLLFFSISLGTLYFLAPRALVPFFGYDIEQNVWLYIIAFGIGAVMVSVSGAAFPVRMTEFEIQEIEDANDLQSIESASHEQKAYKLLRIQQSQLTRFLAVILGQSKIIFGVGLLAMLIGVGVIMYAIHEARGSGGDPEKWVVGALGAVGAILTNYVASVYIKMFGDIGGAVKDSVAMLAKSSNVNFANVLVSKMDQDKTARDNAYKELAVAIVSKS